MSAQAIDDQPLKRRIQLLRQSTQLLAVATGCFVQRISVSDLRRLRKPDADESDPVVRELKKENLDQTFRRCNSASVYLSDSIDAIVNVADQDKTSEGVVFLAWKYSWDSAARRLADPELVGACKMARFLPTDQFSTHEDAVTAGDFAVLKPLFRKYMYIDALCSTAPGVGRLLLMKAYAWAISKKALGIVALSYTKSPSGTPESYKLFEALNFEALIPKAKYKPAFLRRNPMYGTWFTKPTDALGVSSISEAGVRVCTRRGYTERTADNFIWRCPA